MLTKAVNKAFVFMRVGTWRVTGKEIIPDDKTCSKLSKSQINELNGIKSINTKNTKTSFYAIVMT